MPRGPKQKTRAACRTHKIPSRKSCNMRRQCHRQNAPDRLYQSGEEWSLELDQCTVTHRARVQPHILRLTAPATSRPYSAPNQASPCLEQVSKISIFRVLGTLWTLPIRRRIQLGPPVQRVQPHMIRCTKQVTHPRRLFFFLPFFLPG